MKIVFVNIGMLMFRGGGENFDINMSRALRALGHKTELYTLKPVFRKVLLSKPEGYDLVHVVRSPWFYPLTSFLHRYEFTRKLVGIRGIPRILGQMIFELRVFYRLWRVRDEQFVVHTCALPLLSFLVTKGLGRCGILRMPGPIGNVYDKYFGLKTAAIVANGDAFKQIKEKCSPKALHFINVGVSPFKEPPTRLLERMRESLKILQGTFVVIFVGRLIPIKNISMLLRAFERFQGAKIPSKLLIVGDGPDYQKYRSMALRLGLDGKVLFLGKRGQDELSLLYRLADVCVLTSRYDNYPNVFIEAMACGTPCVGTSVGGIPDIVRSGINGEVVKPNDYEGLAGTLHDIASGAVLFERDFIRRRTLEMHSWGQSASRLVEVVEEYKSDVRRKTA